MRKSYNRLPYIKCKRRKLKMLKDILYPQEKVRKPRSYYRTILFSKIPMLRNSLHKYSEVKTIYRLTLSLIIYLLINNRLSKYASRFLLATAKRNKGHHVDITNLLIPM